MFLFMEAFMLFLNCILILLVFELYFNDVLQCNLRLDNVMEVSWEFYRGLWQEHHLIFGLKEQSLKIVQLLQQGNAVLQLILECFEFINLILFKD